MSSPHLDYAAMGKAIVVTGIAELIYRSLFLYGLCSSLPLQVIQLAYASAAAGTIWPATQ